MTKTFYKRIPIFAKLAFGLFLVFGFYPVLALTTYAPNTAITIGEFVYDDDYNATTTDCLLSIWAPAGAAVVTNQLMTANANGWHYYNFAGSSTLGTWPATMSCGTAGVDLIKGDKSFIIATSSYPSDVAAAVWSEPTRTLTDYSTSTISNAVWSNATRSLTSFGTLVADIWGYSGRTLTAFGSLAADVWNDSYAATRRLTSALLSSGSLATLSDVQNASSSIVTNINTNTDTRIGQATSSILTAVNANGTAIASASSSLSGQIQAVNADVLSASSSLSGQIASVSTAVSNVNTNLASASSSLSTQIQTTNSNVLAASSTIGSMLATISGLISGLNNITVADVWNYGTRTLTSFGTLASDINTNTDTRIGQATSSILTAVNANGTAIASASSSLSGQIQALSTTVSTVNTNLASASSSLSGQVLGVSASLASASSSLSGQIQSASSTLGSLIASVSSLVSGLNNITVADVWSYGTRTLTGATLSSGSLATQSDVTSASSSLSGQIQTVGTNLLSASSTIGTRLSTISSLISAISTLTVSDIWNAPTRTLTSLTLSSQTPWTVSASDFGSLTAGSDYLATVTTVYNGTLTDSLSLPTITIYDPSRNVVVNAANMTRVATGTYTYSYTTAGNAEAGTWESVFSATVESGKTLPGNDYWTVVTSPAQVIIRSISDDTAPTISANATITNEGTAGYEYQYEWCVVSNSTNACGGGDDVFYGSAAKFINPGEDFDTTLDATVTNAGNYYFKLVVYFGTESSGSSRSFTVVQPSSNSGNNGGGGGGGGGSSVPSPSPITPVEIPSTCNGADFNRDGKVNGVDFSILLFFWKTKAPFGNPCVDINGDTSVNGVDFSILLSQWGTSGKPFKR